MEQKAMIIGEETVKKYLSVEDVIKVVEDTWRWYGEGKVEMPNKITTNMDAYGVAGWFNSMPVYIAPMDVAGIKVVGEQVFCALSLAVTILTISAQAHSPQLWQKFLLPRPTLLLLSVQVLWVTQACFA